jgi:hypothetical protein
MLGVVCSVSLFVLLLGCEGVDGPLPPPTVGSPPAELTVEEARPELAVGDLAELNDEGDWTLVRIVAITDDGYRVHYIGSSDDWDVGVDPSVLRPPPGDAQERARNEEPAPDAKPPTGPSIAVGTPVWAVSSGGWYRARIIAVHDDGQVTVHYDDWSDDENETVDPTSLRLTVDNP